MLTKKKLLAEIQRVEKEFLAFKMNMQIKTQEIESAVTETSKKATETKPATGKKEKTIEKKKEEQSKK